MKHNIFLRRSAAVVYQCAVLTCTLVLSGLASAGQFSVTPVRIYMQPKERATAITLTNEGETELVMQADIYQWQQKPNGEDDLTLSEDLILAPPIIRLAPKARQVVRLAMLKPLPAGKQHTFRMIVREIPEAIPPKEGVQVQIAIAFSLPVFITPAGNKHQLRCTVQRSASDTAMVNCENLGNAHALTTGFKLISESGAVIASREDGGYLLSGNQRSFEIKRTDGSIPAGKLRLQLTHGDLSTQVFDVVLTQ